jgi:O-antigen/teichoic acid export membrane protein
MGYQSAAIKGFSWVGALRTMIRGTGFVRMAILARLLSPAQFGTFGIAALVLGLIEMLTETGINVVLIQERDESTVDNYLNTAWSLSIIRGLIISLILLIVAAPLSRFFHNPSALPILIMISVVPLIRGFINPAIVKFQKRLRFDQEFKFRAGLILIEAVVSIWLALITHSAISLVWGMLAAASAEVLFSFLFISPRPRWSLVPDQFRIIFHRGKWITLTGTVNYLYLNGPDLTIGRLLDAASLGIYQMAFRFGYTPVAEVGDMSNRVTFPIFVQIAQDKIRTRRAFWKNMLTICTLMFPVMLILVFFPSQIVNLFLGPQWLSVIPLLPLMGITVFFGSLTAPASSLLMAIKRQHQVFYFNLIRTISLWLIIIPLVKTLGVSGGAIALIISALIALPYTVFAAYKALY